MISSVPSTAIPTHLSPRSPFATRRYPEVALSVQMNQLMALSLWLGCSPCWPSSSGSKPCLLHKCLNASTGFRQPTAAPSQVTLRYISEQFPNQSCPRIMSAYPPPNEVVNRSSNTDSRFPPLTHPMPSLRPDIEAEGDASIIADRPCFSGATPDCQGWSDPAQSLLQGGASSLTLLCHLLTGAPITGNGNQYQFRSNIAFQGMHPSMLTVRRRTILMIRKAAHP